jgi:hypothetical protein
MIEQRHDLSWGTARDTTMIHRNGAFMRSSQVELAKIEHRIRDFNRRGQLREAVYRLLGCNDEWTDQICRSYDVSLSSSIRHDATVLQREFGYDVWPALSYLIPFWPWDTDSAKVLKGALMLIGSAAHNLSQQHLRATWDAARSVQAGKLYHVLQTLLGNKAEEAKAVCSRIGVPLYSNASFDADHNAIRTRFLFSIQEHSPGTFLQATLLMLGLDTYQRAWSQRVKQSEGQAVRATAETAGPTNIAEEPRHAQPATSLLLVVRASKFGTFPPDGETVSSELVDSWLLEATYYSCLPDIQADGLEGHLQLEQQAHPVGEEDIYVRVALPPEAAPQGSNTRYDIREAMHTAGRKKVRVVKLRRLNTRESLGLMSEFKTT